ncbi:hypothetical protein K0M31_018036 [Melipona bicolor]|uniref:Uncharacterized protein n=1 Tax=Melipona bicolor TaxID=60889 RepID=A0AA40KE49_9HYME|nr:hypothetical protein K0M31_018036 [Melipona bicolor]
MREPSKEREDRGGRGRETGTRERDENKADTAAGATMAHRPAKTRADAQKRTTRDTPVTWFPLSISKSGDVYTRSKLDELNWMRLTVFLRFPRFGFNLRHDATSRNRSILEDTSFQFVPVNGAGLRSMVQDG